MPGSGLRHRAVESTFLVIIYVRPARHCLRHVNVESTCFTSVTLIFVLSLHDRRHSYGVCRLTDRLTDRPTAAVSLERNDEERAKEDDLLDSAKNLEEARPGLRRGPRRLSMIAGEDSDEEEKKEEEEEKGWRGTETSRCQ